MQHIFIFNFVVLAALICLSISPKDKNRPFKVEGTLLSRKTGKPVEDTLVEITGKGGEVLYWSMVDLMITSREAKVKTNSTGYFRISVFTEDEKLTFKINATQINADLPKKYSVSKKDGGNFWETYSKKKFSVGEVYMEDTTWRRIVKKVEKKVNEIKEVVDQVVDEEIDRRTPR
ncbi:hypothetical protein Ddc_15357 [Ditylenchus destructor]|nr:hypothetical protein Ddc_15357 [Ditylenchus destructor]